MKKITIYLDTNSLFSGKLCRLEKYIDQLSDILESNDHLNLLINDVLRLEIEDKINNKIMLPRLDSCFSENQVKEIEKVFESNKEKYRKSIVRLFALGEKVEINPSNADVIEGCNRQYQLEAPWSSGKTNEWKDFFVQGALLSYHKSNSDHDKMVILSTDNGFGCLEKSEKIEIRKTPLKSFVEYLYFYTKEGRESFKSYLINQIYSTLGEKIEEEIIKNIYEEGVYLEDPEIEIEDITVIDASDEDNIRCEVKASVSGTDLTNATYDKEDRRYYNEDYFNSKERYELYVSFEGEYNEFNHEKKQLIAAKETGVFKDNNVVHFIEIRRI